MNSHEKNMSSVDWSDIIVFVLLGALVWLIVNAGDISLARDQVVSREIRRCETTDMFFTIYDSYLYTTSANYRFVSRDLYSSGDVVDVSLADYFNAIFPGLGVNCAPLSDFTPNTFYNLPTPTPFWTTEEQPCP